MPDLTRIGLGLFLGVALSTGALACRCVVQTPRSAIRSADGIIVARVMSLDDRDRHARTYQLEVERSWKMAVQGRAAIRSFRTTCMAELVIGQRYLLHLSRQPSGLETNRCVGNLLIDKAGAELALLDHGPSRGRAR